MHPDLARVDRYRPPDWLIHFVKARDGHCRFPGCSVNARFCDVDHVVPWPVGATSATNLICLCRRHHRIKQRVRWRVLLSPDGTTTWTDPTGATRTTHAADFLLLDRGQRPLQPVRRSEPASMPTRPRSRQQWP